MWYDVPLALLLLWAMGGGPERKWNVDRCFVFGQSPYRGGNVSRVGSIYLDLFWIFRSGFDADQNVLTKV